MNIFFQFFSFLFAIFLLVTVHEYGHFWVARRCGVKVLAFSIGFGKTLFRWYDKHGTEYIIAILPLGGYVRLLDEREGHVPEEMRHLEFTGKPIWKRFLILLAGPLTNWVLAFFLFWIILWVGMDQVRPIIGEVLPNSIAAQAGLSNGDQFYSIDQTATPTWQKVLIRLFFRLGDKGTLPVQVLHTDKAKPLASELKTHTLNLANWYIGGLNPDPLKSLGIKPYAPKVPAVLHKILPSSPAAKADLQLGDEIVSVDGKTISGWLALIEYIQNRPNQKIKLGVLRKGKIQDVELVIGSKLAPNFSRVGFLGIGTSPVEMPANVKFRLQYSFLEAAKQSVEEVYSFTLFNFVLFGKMAMGHISLQGLGGPITIFNSASEAFSQGVLIYISFLALLSTMLAAINILPIPGLDGGHILLLAIEAFRRKPLSIPTQLWIYRAGALFLVTIMLIATVNDLMKFF